MYFVTNQNELLLEMIHQALANSECSVRPRVGGELLSLLTLHHALDE